MIRAIFAVIALAVILFIAAVTVLQILEVRDMEWQTKQLPKEEDEDEQQTIS